MTQAQTATQTPPAGQQGTLAGGTAPPAPPPTPPQQPPPPQQPQGQAPQQPPQEPGSNAPQENEETTEAASLADENAALDSQLEDSRRAEAKSQEEIARLNGVVTQMQTESGEQQLLSAKFRHIASTFLRKPFNIDDEVREVAGLSWDAEKGQVVGDPYYRPPRVSRSRAVDARADGTQNGATPSVNGANQSQPLPAGMGQHGAKRI